MSTGPISVGGSLAAAAFNQAKGSEADRAQTDQSRKQTQSASDKAAEAAAGIGSTEAESEAAGDRDADGRRLWEKMGHPGSKPGDAAAPGSAAVSKDPTGERGNALDLSG